MATINVSITGGATGTYVVLYDITNDISTKATTDGSGNYSFTGLAIGDYQVFNTGIDTGAENPPTFCGFPLGYTGTRDVRREDVTISGAADTVNLTFEFDKPV